MTVAAETNTGTAIPGEVAPVAAADAPEAATPDAVEARARSMGWVPKEEFRGQESRWTEAGAFVERAEKELPLALARSRKLEGKVANLERDLAQSVRSMGAVAQQAYDKAMSDIAAQKEAAVEVGDVARFRQLEQKQAEVHKKHVEAVTVPQGPPAEVTEWIAENKWFGTDSRLKAIAIGLEPEFAKDNPGASPREVLDMVTEEVKRLYPAKFSNGARAAPPAVEGVGEARGGQRGGKTYSDLPADAKAICDRWDANKTMSKAEYVKEFFANAR